VGLKFIVILTTLPSLFIIIIIIIIIIIYDALSFKFEVHALSHSLIILSLNTVLSIIAYNMKGIGSLSRFIIHCPHTLLISPFKWI